MFDMYIYMNVNFSLSFWVSDNVFIFWQLQCLDAEFDYGYEYIGSSNREVITPLTERVFVALCQSIRAHMGGMCVGAMVRESFILDIYMIAKLNEY